MSESTSTDTPRARLDLIIKQMRTHRPPRSIGGTLLGSPEQVANQTHDAILALAAVVEDQEERIAKIEGMLANHTSVAPDIAGILGT